MDVVEYQKIKRRMVKRCRASSCNECPLSSDNNKEGIYCADFEQNYPEKAVAIVEQWAKENPAKTYKSAFLEKFPNAIVDCIDDPHICLKYVFGEKAMYKNCGKHDLCISCHECWNQEYKENEV